MVTKFSDRDWEALSAYLDGQLTSKDRARLDIRLEDDPDLRAAIEDLHRTRLMLRSLSEIRAPRNFALTPEMAGIRSGTRQPPNAYPVLRLASALAAIFFIVVFVGDLVTSRLKPVTNLEMQAQQEEMPPAMWPSVIGRGGGSGEENQMEKSFEAPVEEATALAVEIEAETEAMESAVFGTPTPSEIMEEMASALSEGESLDVTPLAAQAAEPLAESEMSAPAEDRALQAPKDSAGLEDMPGVGEQPGTDSGTLRAQARGWTVLRILQVLLALMAIGAGLGAFYLRRSANR